VWRPDASSSLTVDAYRLKVKDVIIATETLQGATVTAAYVAAGLPGFTQASYYTNGWDSRTDGIDIIGKRHFSVGAGGLELSAAASLINTSVSNVHRYVTIGGAAILAVSNAKMRDAETGTPKNKIVLGARYNVGEWTLDSSVTRYGRYRYNVGDVAGVAAANGNVDQVFSPETYVDFGVAYAISKRWKVDLNIQNAFNRYPDKYLTANRASGINPYSFIATEWGIGPLCVRGREL
jgi:iron complex outermembrane receptor protein